MRKMGLLCDLLQFTCHEGALGRFSLSFSATRALMLRWGLERSGCGSSSGGGGSSDRGSSRWCGGVKHVGDQVESVVSGNNRHEGESGDNDNNIQDVWPTQAIGLELSFDSGQTAIEVPVLPPQASFQDACNDCGVYATGIVGGDLRIGGLRPGMSVWVRAVVVTSLIPVSSVDVALPPLPPPSLPLPPPPPVATAKSGSNQAAGTSEKEEGKAETSAQEGGQGPSTSEAAAQAQLLMRVTGAWHKFGTTDNVPVGARVGVGSNTTDIFGKQRGRARGSVHAKVTAAASAAAEVAQTEGKYQYDHPDCPLGYCLPPDRREGW